MNVEIFPISSYVLTNATLCGSPAPQCAAVLSAAARVCLSLSFREAAPAERGRTVLCPLKVASTNLPHSQVQLCKVYSCKKYLTNNERKNPRWNEAESKPLTTKTERDSSKLLRALSVFSSTFKGEANWSLSKKNWRKKNSLKCFGEVSKKVDYQVIHSEKLFEKIPWDLLTCHHSVPKVMTVHIMDHHLVNIAKHRK